MQHQNVDQIRSLADIRPGLPPGTMSPRERLDRWAEVLDREPKRQLSTLDEMEWVPKADRPSMRADNSPLTVAFEDPLLREEGLKSDRLGDALTFFDISENDAHHIMCSCLNGRTMSARSAAARIRSIGDGRVARVSTAFILGGALGAPVLLYLLG